MLTQMLLGGKLQKAAGIVFGECLDYCGPSDDKPSFAWDMTFGRSAGRLLSRSVQAPVLLGLTIGHTNDQLTLPLGVMATLNANKGF